MKILSGYDDKYKTDYRAKVAEEVEQLRRKADLLREMLLGVAHGETIGQGDVFEVQSSSFSTLFVLGLRLRLIGFFLGPGDIDSGITAKVAEIDRG
jgi:hypothetical protein